MLGLGAASLCAQHSLTPGQFAVNDAGAATYSIPLTVAPGFGGLSPKLKLQYSSQAPNGVFGVGWALSGISSITRCAKNPAEDNQRLGVQNNSGDLFCLDGQKLRAVNNGTYGAPGTRYRTAIDTYARITSEGTMTGGSGPQYFTLNTKTGETYTFGGVASPQSSLEHPSKKVIRTWMLSEIKDRYNNSIQFLYEKDTVLGEQKLTKIDYGNGQLLLEYEDRPLNDQILKYDDGLQYGSTRKRVKNITVKHKPVVNGTPTPTTFRIYQFNYLQSQASQRSMLSAIKECTPDMTCLPPVTFTYRGGVPGNFSKMTATHNFLPSNSLFPRQYGLKDTNGVGKQEIHQYGVIPNMPSTETLVPPEVLWDIDGDSKTDILYYASFNCNGSSSCTKKVTRYGSGAGESSQIINSTEKIGCFSDIDGNGTSDAIVFYSVFKGSSNSGRDYYYIKNPSGGADFQAGFGEVLSSCKSIDVNGDGKSEILLNTGVVLSYTGNAWVKLGMPSASLQQYALGDFNGDGKTDILHAGSVYLSLGDASTPFNTWSTTPKVVACTGDFNGDGRTDVLLDQNTLDLSTGSGKNTVTQNVLPLSSSLIACGDFNGDGLMDVATPGFYWQNDLPADVDRLIKVDNGAGYSHEVSYKPITDNAVYSKGTGAVYPQIDMQTPIMVVSNVKAETLGQGSQNTSYKYKNLRADLKRNGTQGFEQVVSTVSETQVSVSTDYHQSHPFTGMRSQILKYINNTEPVVLIEKTTYAYENRPVIAGISEDQLAQVHLKTITVRHFDLKNPGSQIGKSITTFGSYDRFGYPDTETTEYFDGSSDLPSSQVKRTDVFGHSEEKWLLGQLIKSTTDQKNFRDLGSVQANGVPTGTPPTVPPSPPPLSGAQAALLMVPILNILLD